MPPMMHDFSFSGHKAPGNQGRRQEGESLAEFGEPSLLFDQTGCRQSWTTLNHLTIAKELVDRFLDVRGLEFPLANGLKLRSRGAPDFDILFEHFAVFRDGRL